MYACARLVCVHLRLVMLKRFPFPVARTGRPRERDREGERAGGRGLGVVLHLGWSVSHCGKTQYLHFVIRNTFTLLFSTTRIYAHLTAEGGSLGPNDLHLFVSTGRSGRRWVCVCVRVCGCVCACACACVRDDVTERMLMQVWCRL